MKTSPGFDAANYGGQRGALEQSVFNNEAAAPLILPIEKAPPTIVIRNEHTALPNLPKDLLNMSGFVPTMYPSTELLAAAPLPTSTAVLPPITKPEEEQPKTNPSVETLAARRPVRKSSLKRTFNIEDLDASVNSDDDDDKRTTSGRKKKKLMENQHSLSSHEGAAPAAPAGAAATIPAKVQQPVGQPRRGRPPAKGRGTDGVAKNKNNNESQRQQQQRRGIPPWARDAQNQPNALPAIKTQRVRQQPPPRRTPQEVIPCPLDYPYPRKSRSEIKTCPKTSRASITRLKQAAHGTLPLGGSKSLALALLGGGAVDVEDKEEGYPSDDSGSCSRRHRTTATGKRQAHSGSKGESVGPYSLTQQQQRQQRLGQMFPGPNEKQKQAMEEIAAAPSELRATLIQKLMQEKLGIPIKPASLSVAGNGNASGSGMARVPVPAQVQQQPRALPSPLLTPLPPGVPLLSSLPRSEQHLIVKQLMSQMTPQQRHTMLQLAIPHQAELLQQYYVRYVVPKMQPQPQQQLPIERQPSFPMMPFSANVAPANTATTTTTTTQASGVLNREASTPSLALPLDSNHPTPPLSSLNGASFLRELLSELGETAEAQLAAMPREQQQKILLGLIQRRRQKLLMQQQLQSMNGGFGGGDALPSELTRRHSHQVALGQNQRQGSLEIRNPAALMMNNPLDRHHSMPPLGHMPGPNGGVPGIGNNPVMGGGGGGLFAPEVAGLDLLGSGGLDADSDALQDAMNFLV
jgi:hypothetical protein